MRKRIYSVILKIVFVATLFAVGVDLLFVHVIIPQQYDFSNVKKIGRLIEETDPNEIPIFGSSIAKRSYYPDSLGANFYNYGMAGSIYVMIEPLLKIELAKEKDSPIVIDFEHHFFLSHEEIRIQLSNYIPHVDNVHIRTMLEERDLLSSHYDIPGLRLFGQYDEYMLDLFRLRMNRELTNKGGIFFKPKKRDFTLIRQRRQNLIDEKRELIAEQEHLPQLMSRRKRKKLELLDILLNSRPDESYVARFEKLLEEHSNRNFILVYSPQHEIKLMGLENHDEVLALLQRLEDAHPNLHVLDYSLMEFPDRFYHDSGHMNLAGANAFSGILKRDLKPFIQ